jgi:hypothetical protein
MNEIKVGDIITAFHSGYHRVTAIYDDSDFGTMVQYTRVADSNGKSTKKTENSCHIGWCEKITLTRLDKMYVDNYNQITNKHLLLRKLLEQNV